MNRRFWLVSCIIVLFTFGLRVAQIGHGLPDVQMGDENSDLTISVRMLKGELPPTITRYHRSTTSNLELLGIGAVYVTQVLKTGDFSVAKFQDLYFSDRGQFTFAVRLLIVIIGAVAQLALANLSAKALSPLTGILAALLAGSYYLWNLHSLYAMPDSLSPSAIIFFLWAVFLVLQKGTRLSYAIAGITLAFVMLTKLFNLPIFVALLTAHGFRAWNEGGKEHFWRQFLQWRRLAVFAVALVCSNLILNPWAFIHPMDLITEWQTMSDHMNRDNTYSNILNPIQLANMIMINSSLAIRQYIGIFLSIAMLSGIVAVVAIRKQAVIILLIAAITIWLTIAIQAYKESYWISTLPFIVILSSIGLSSLINWASKEKSLLYGGAVLLVAAVILNELRLTIDVAIAMRQDYTYTEAQNYIFQNWPRESSVLMGPNITYSVPIERNQESIQRASDLGAPILEAWAWWLRQPINTRLHEYNIYGPEFEQVINTYADAQRLIADNHIQYVIEIDTCLGNGARPTATSAQEFPPINQEIRQHLQLIKTYSPFVNEAYCPALIYDRTTLLNRDEVQYFARPGPIVRLFQTTDQVLTMPPYF